MRPRSCAAERCSTVKAAWTIDDLCMTFFIVCDIDPQPVAF
jgi:hypothetical protein